MSIVNALSYSCSEMREQSYFKASGAILSIPQLTLVSFGVYPSKLKHAKAIPIYKGEDETDPRN